MKRRNAYLLSLSVPSLCGCALDPGESTGGIDVEQRSSKGRKEAFDWLLD